METTIYRNHNNTQVFNQEYMDDRVCTRLISDFLKTHFLPIKFAVLVNLRNVEDHFLGKYNAVGTINFPTRSNLPPPQLLIVLLTYHPYKTNCNYQITAEVYKPQLDLLSIFI
jgi:hypothetical protein